MGTVWPGRLDEMTGTRPERGDRRSKTVSAGSSPPPGDPGKGPQNDSGHPVEDPRQIQSPESPIDGIERLVHILQKEDPAGEIRKEGRSAQVGQRFEIPPPKRA